MVLRFLTLCRVRPSRRFGKRATSVYMVAICCKWMAGRRKYVSYGQSLQFAMSFNQS